MELWAILQFVAGLVLLVAGAELLVRSASVLARQVGVPPVVIGLTVVAFGTSAPELAISLQAAWSGQGDIAVGNVVGSNIANILLILGISAAITPLAVAQQIVRLDVPIMVGASFVTVLLAANGQIGRVEGLFLAALLVAYVVFTVRQTRVNTPAVEAEYSAEYGGPPPPPRSGARLLASRLATLALGLIVMVWGARWLVASASAIARGFGVSELVIGLTVVAIGTSAPELATSIVAAMRGERDIAVGNVVGSNIFNLLFVLGLTASVAPAPIFFAESARTFDLPIMVAVAVACLPIFYTRYTVRRWEGLLFLGYYVAYTAVLYLLAIESPSLPWVRWVMLAFVVPLTVLGIAFSLYHERRLRRSEAAAALAGGE